MPSPVEALPCGSRSMISTCSPMAASAVPRLMAVVVLPTPPFWLAIARTRGSLGAATRPIGPAIAVGSTAGTSVTCVIDPHPPRRIPACRPRLAARAPWFQAADHHNACPGIGSAGNKISRHLPTFRGCGQFSLYILSLGEHTDRPPLQQRQALAEQQA